MLRRFVKQAVAYLPARLLPALTAFITTPILTRLFPPTEYGHWSLASGVSEFLIALTCSGLGSAVIRFFPAYKEKSELGVFFSSLSFLTTALVLVVSTGSFSTLLLLRGYLSGTLYPVLLLSIPIFAVQGVFAVSMTVVRAQERGGLFTAYTLLSYYGGLGIGLLLVIVGGFRVEGLLLGTLLTLILILPFLVSSATKQASIRPRHFRAADALEMWHYAWPLALGNVALWALRLSDRYMISFFRPEREVGLYSVAYNISGRSIDMLVALLLLAAYPIAMNTWENRGQEATEKVLTVMTRLYLLLCLPAAVGLSVLSSPLVSLLASETYHEGHRIVGYVAFASFFLGLARFAQMGIVIKRKARRLGTNEIIGALVNLGLNLVLVPRFGFLVAGINALISYVILFVLHARASRPHLKWELPARTLRNALIATLCMGLIAYGIYALSDHTSAVPLGSLLLSIVAAVLVYFSCLCWLGEANKAEKGAIGQLWRKAAGRIIAVAGGRHP